VSDQSVQLQLVGLHKLIKEALPQGRGKSIITGPSHAARWRHAINNNILPSPYEDQKIIGEGGYPVWNHTVFSEIFRAHKVGEPIFLILPDFRFGNSLAEESRIVSGQFYAQYTHIKSKLICPEVDAKLYRHHVENLKIWRTVFGSDLTVFDWTTLMTASEHYWTDRHIDADGRYENRNYAEWVFSDRAQIGALSWPVNLLKDENTRLRRLSVDRSLHPSGIGFFMLHYMFHGDSFLVALEKAENLWAQWVKTLVEMLAPMLAVTGPVLLTGDSAWFKVALRLLGPEDIVALNTAGLFFAKGASAIGAHQNEQPAKTCQVKLTDSVTVSDYGVGSAVRPLVFQWGCFARTIVSERHINNVHLAVPEIEKIAHAEPDAELGQIWLRERLDCESPDTFVDAGSDLAPTFSGLAMLLLTITDAIRTNVTSRKTNDC